jgi:hypothetical protein
MDDVSKAEVRRGVRLPRVTSAPAAGLFSAAEGRPGATGAPLGEPLQPEREPVSTTADWEVPRHASDRPPRTGRVLVGLLVGAAILVTPLIVWSAHSRDHHRAGPAARPRAGPVTSATSSGLADPTPAPTRTLVPTPQPTLTGLRENKDAGGSPHAKAHPKFSVVAGPGCPGGAYLRTGFYTDGDSGWLAGSQGYSGAGCDGRFDALPMSGSTTSDDPTLFVRWAFDPGSHHECAVSVFIPGNGNKVLVGGEPAHYSVHQQSGGAQLAGFHIDQPAALGRWVRGGSFTAQGAFYVRLDNTGKDWSGDRNTYAHVAAAQVRAACD